MRKFIPRVVAPTVVLITSVVLLAHTDKPDYHLFDKKLSKTNRYCMFWTA